LISTFESTQNGFYVVGICEDVPKIGDYWVVVNKILDGGVVGAYYTRVKIKSIESPKVFNCICIFQRRLITPPIIC